MEIIIIEEYFIVTTFKRKQEKTWMVKKAKTLDVKKY